MTRAASDEPIRIGISRCILGDEVRYDGGHKHDRFVTDVLGRFFAFEQVCPEVEVGMGVPRETVHLVGHRGAPRMLGTESGTDWTRKMNRRSARLVELLEKARISGFILQQKSPSCGMERVKIVDDKGQPRRVGRGLFAMAIMERLPLLPVEEAGRLQDVRLRENFIVRVFAYARLRQLFNARFSRAAVVEFHTDHESLLMAHSPKLLRELGRLVARIDGMPAAEFRPLYGELFMKTLQVRTTARKNVDVLQRLLGHLKNHIGEEERTDILGRIDDYHQGLAPLVVPLTLLRHHLDLHRVPGIDRQAYLNPHPKELMLRNHA